MATNATVLIIVAAMAALALTGMATVVVYKTRTQTRHGLGGTIRTQVRENTLRLQRLEVLAVISEVPPPPHVAELTLAAPASNRHGPVTVSQSGSP